MKSDPNSRRLRIALICLTVVLSSCSREPECIVWAFEEFCLGGSVDLLPDGYSNPRSHSEFQYHAAEDLTRIYAIAWAEAGRVKRVTKFWDDDYNFRSDLAKQYAPL